MGKYKVNVFVVKLHAKLINDHDQYLFGLSALKRITEYNDWLHPIGLDNKGRGTYLAYPCNMCKNKLIVALDKLVKTSMTFQIRAKVIGGPICLNKYNFLVGFSS